MMETDAKSYSALNKPQYEKGCEFVRVLHICEGDKVLDMGCGTGEVTRFIASLVGIHGEVVGVDPDESRIKIAQEKYKDVVNLRYVVGGSSSKFPHHDQEYYDLHFSNSVLHWCVGDEKKEYLEKAYQCLKVGGRLAFQTGVTPELLPPPVMLPNVKDFHFQTLTEAEYKQMCEGYSFKIISTKTLFNEIRFSSFKGLKAWFKASCHRELTEFDPVWVKLFLEKSTKEKPNGNVIMSSKTLFRLIAEKKTSLT